MMNSTVMGLIDFFNGINVNDYQLNTLGIGSGFISGYIAPNIGIIYIIISLIIYSDLEKYFIGGYVFGLFIKIYNIKLILVGVVGGLLIKNNETICKFLEDKIDLEKVKNIIVNINNYAREK